MDLSMATVGVYTEAKALEGLGHQWQQLLDRTDGAMLYQTPQWALAWQRASGNRSLPFGIALWDRERLVGFAPLCIATVWGARVVRFMGGDLNDFNCLLAEPAFLTAFRAAVARVLSEHSEKWDVLFLTGLADQDRLVEGLRADLPARAGLHRLGTTELPTIALPGHWETYQEQLSRRRRKTLRYAQRLLQARGKVGFRVLTEPHELAQALGIFFAARMENWRARKRLHRMVAIQRTSGYWTTLTKICLELAAQGRVWLARLSVDGAAVAWDLAFVTNGIVTDYMTTYDLRYGHASPGHLVTIEMIRFSIEQGARCFVLGRGAQPYKYWLGGAPGTTESLILYANRPRGQVYVGVQLMRERALEMARGLQARTRLRIG